VTDCLEGRFTQRVNLRFSWSESVCSSSGYSSMFLVSAPFWHVAGMRHAHRCELSAKRSMTVARGRICRAPVLVPMRPRRAKRPVTDEPYAYVEAERRKFDFACDQRQDDGSAQAVAGQCGCCTSLLHCSPCANPTATREYGSDPRILWIGHLDVHKISFAIKSFEFEVYCLRH
jgi:hypothetical protein